MMNSIQLDEILKRNQSTSSIFIGVFARDELPSISNYPCCFILNTAKRSDPGQHWIAFYFDSNKNCNFFDSYGNHPSFFKLMDFIKKYSTNLIYNKKVVQSWTSMNCGYYCILFLILKSSGHSMKKISDLFYDCSYENIDLIEKFKNKF